MKATSGAPVTVTVSSSTGENDVVMVLHLWKLSALVAAHHWKVIVKTCFLVRVMEVFQSTENSIIFVFPPLTLFYDLELQNF